MCLKLINSGNLVMISKSFTINYPYSSRTQHLIVISLSSEIWNTERNELGKEYKTVYCHSAYLTYMWSKYIMQNARLDEAQDGIKIAGRNTNNLR